MCGIVGIIGASAGAATTEAAREALLALTTLQHRGQDAAGILTLNNEGLHRVRNNGLVESVFNRENIESLKGAIALGHTRYATAGRGDITEVQPLILNYPFGIGMVHNGNIVNAEVLAQELKTQHRRQLLTHSDTEVLLNIFAQKLSSFQTDHLSFEQLCEAVQDLQKRAIGSYSIAAVIGDHGLLAFRDPHGIRPLVWGKRDGAHMVASESVAVEFNGYEVVRNLEPGELLYVDLEGKVHTKVLEKRTPRPCMFEWIYFASPESTIDNVPVYGSRIGLGKSLAQVIQKRMKEQGLEADVVVPVPETARIAAIALSEELGVPYRELLIKNRYIKRTFILDTQDKRQKAVNLKLSPVKSEIKGKRVILVDDSIVRGTTSKKIIDLVRKAGATQVYFVSTCPPIRSSCYYGIDFPNPHELIANDRSEKEIEQELGADAVIYQSIEGLRQALIEAGKQSPQFQPCMACLDGHYPTDIGDAKKMQAARVKDRAIVEGQAR